MAQLTNVGQGQQQWAAFAGPLASSIMLLLSLVFALLGIKIWGFRRRLTFDRAGSSTTARATQQQQQPQSAPRYAAYESQINGTETAVHGVFRQRNIEDFEYARPAGAAANKFLTGSVPNLEVASLTRYEYKEETSIPELDAPVTHRREPQARQSRRREVHSASYDYYISAPPTRQPPPPPIAAEGPPQPSAAAAAAAAAPPSQLDIPHFDHFAEKYALISAKVVSGDGRESQLRMKQIGDYIKYEQVDDVPEILTPDDDQVGAAISVAAQVHQAPSPAAPAAVQPKSESELKAEVEPVPAPRATIEPNSRFMCNNQFLELERTESAFVVEIIAGTPDSTDLRHPIVERNLFADLELPHHLEDVEFERIRSSYEMNEADILDMRAELPSPTSPPGFGKSIDDDWENFENLESVTNPLQPLELPQRDQIEMINPFEQEDELKQRTKQATGLMEPPPYKESQPASPPILPDYESLMQLEASHSNRKLPNYADVVAEREEPEAKYVSSIEDLFMELQSNGSVSSPNSAKVVRDFDALCEELNIAAPSPVPARRPPQPAPRSTRPTTLSVRGDLPPLSCYEPEELASTSSSGEDAAEIAVPPKRTNKRALKVRFDVDNLQYYQAAELPSSSDSDFGGELDEPQPLPSIRRNFVDNTPSPMFEPDIPRLFGTQVSQEDSDDEYMGRVLRQHRTLTQTLSSFNDRVSEA